MYRWAFVRYEYITYSRFYSFKVYSKQLVNIFDLYRYGTTKDVRQGIRCSKWYSVYTRSIQLNNFYVEFVLKSAKEHLRLHLERREGERWYLGVPG
jgi:hypothetical protein